MTGEMDTVRERSEGMGWRVSTSIVTFFGATIAVILWLFFFAGEFSIYQNLAIVAVISLVFVGVMGATWASWGIRHGYSRTESEKA